MSYAIKNRRATTREVAGHLGELVSTNEELARAAETLRVELFQSELRRIARESIARAPEIRRLSQQMLDSVRPNTPIA